MKNCLIYFSRFYFFFTLTFNLSSNAVAHDFSIASKRFTESYVLAELIASTLEKNAQIQVIRKQSLGSTGIVFNALREGEIDLYPEYWGTLTQEILKTNSSSSLAQVNEKLLVMGLKAGFFLGFNNTYALVIKKSQADALKIHSISDLKGHPNLRLGLSQEFLARDDGWRGLSKAYGLSSFKPTGLDHGLGYQALENNQIDLMDAYSTDPRLIGGKYELLKDDVEYFASYKALLIYRISSVESNPKILQALKSLESTLSEGRMQVLNSRVEIEGKNPSTVVLEYIEKEDQHYRGRASNNADTTAQSVERVNPDFFANVSKFIGSFFKYDFLRITYQHTLLVFTALLMAIILGIPLGVWVYAKPRSGGYVLTGISIIQTIPALALLSFLILLVHSIGFWPAFLALLLYALLPIIESTHSGLQQVDPAVKEASKALGAGFWIQLLKIELPLCRPSLYSGVQVAAVWTTGTATIAAFVGAGGYGERIAQGLSTNNTELMLEGAIPAAIFSLGVRYLIDWVSKTKA